MSSPPHGTQPAMLRRDVVDLASRSLSSTLVERRADFPRKIRAIMAQLAAKGIVGGPTVTMISDAARAECDDRIDIATAELQRAADSKGLRYYRKLSEDLESALDKLVENIYGDIAAVCTTTLHVIPNAAAGVARFRSALEMSARGRMLKGRTDLVHYAESLGTTKREQAGSARLKLWQGLAVAAITVVLTLLGQWMISHFVGPAPSSQTPSLPSHTSPAPTRRARLLPRLPLLQRDALTADVDVQ